MIRVKLSESLPFLPRKAILGKAYRHHTRLSKGVKFSKGLGGVWRVSHHGENWDSLSYCAFQKKFRKYAQCHIIASGPSFSAEKLPHRNSNPLFICMNGSPQLLDKVEMKPHILVITDRRFTRDHIEYIKRQVENGIFLVMTHSVTSIIISAGIPLESGQFFIIELINEWYGVAQKTLDKINYPELRFPDKRLSAKIGFSTDVSKGVFSSATVAFTALQLSYSLGYKEIEIHGLDLGGQERAYEEEEPQSSQLDRHLEPFIKPAFSLATTFLKEQNVKLRNHSDRCPLDLNTP